MSSQQQNASKANKSSLHCNMAAPSPSCDMTAIAPCATPKPLIQRRLAPPHDLPYTAGMPLTPDQLAIKRAAGLKGSAIAAEKRRQAKLAPPPTLDDAEHPALAPTREPAISPKVKQAIDAMIWDGVPRGNAAELVGLKDHSLYKALRLPPVKAYYAQQMQVLRDSERPRNIHRAIQIRDAADNMPAMHAIKWLEGEPDQSVSGGRGGAAQSPGVTFVIVQGTPAAPIRDVTPAGSARGPQAIESDD